MKSFLQKSVATLAVVGSTLAPMASQFTAASAVRATAVAGVGALALTASPDASAQVNKRMCATVWDNSVRQGSNRGLAAIGMEVNKLDYVTCTAITAAWIALSTLPNSVESFAKVLLGNSASVGYGLIGDLRFMETCEGFSKRIKANTGDVCLRMTDYKLYAFVKVGSTFSMGRV
jgi:hypothetical protein